MQYKQFIFWISLSMLMLASIVPVTDSCPSSFGFGRKTRRSSSKTTFTESPTSTLDPLTTEEFTAPTTEAEFTAPTTEVESTTSTTEAEFTTPTTEVESTTSTTEAEFTASTTEIEFTTSTTETIDIITMTETPGTTTTDKPSSHKDHIHDCDTIYRDVYCLNGGSCKTHNYTLEGTTVRVMHCDCASHFYGDHCEYKALSGSYGGGLVLSRNKRSFQRSNGKSRGASHYDLKKRKHRRRDSKKKNRRVKTVEVEA